MHRLLPSVLVPALVSVLVAPLVTVFISGLAGSAIAVQPPALPAPPAYDAGVSDPVEDSYYPAKGDPGIDTLHYDLDLTWLRRPRMLVGDVRITLRATTDDNTFQLDLSRAMRVSRVEVDGAPTAYTRAGGRLVVGAPVVGDRRYTVRVRYRGTPEPARGPASRSDIGRVGMRVTDDGQLWTMQEPYGAFTWYPVNDQPADKALYDVRVDVPRGWVGVSNGGLVSRSRIGARTVTGWHSEHPMSSYLTTLAVGPYKVHRQTGPHGLPLTYWVPRDRPRLVRPLLRTPAAIRWLESRLGRYPFDRAGVVVTPSDSAMETQTMITFGVRDYGFGQRSVRQTVVHELAHQWYGNTVTPQDWRDVWMNEGMATYLDTRWAVSQGWDSWRGWQRFWKSEDGYWRRVYGPPGAYERREFASINVYYCTALMLERLRRRIGDPEFEALVRRWPQTHRDTNQSRDSYVDWVEVETGRELSGFFDRWLTARRSPA